MRFASVVGAFATALALAGCGSPSPDDGSSSSPTTSESTVLTPSPSGSSSGAASTPSAGALIGYGAIREDWDASHEQAPGFTPGAAFLPMVNGDQPKYAAVSGELGERILSYEIYFEEGTSLETAKRIVLQEFPPGAKFDVEDDEEARCLILDIRSEPVEAVMDGYRPIVGFFTSPNFSEELVPSHVDNASMLIAAPEETTDLGMC